MASWNDFPVVRFAPSTRVREGERVEWLLWPALAWRVIGPRPRDRALNLFQRSVLGLLCAGRRTAEEIAQRLGLHRELVALVIHELEQVRALDALQRPTEQGKKLFAEDQDDEDELVVGRVFADPFSGELWPRLVARDLPGVAIERSDSGWPIMETGTQGAPRRDRPFVVEMPFPRVERAPQPTEILRAASTHARQIRHGEDAIEELDRPARLERVECLSSHPEAILLAVRVRIGAHGRSIDDPFGVGESQRMRGIVERRIEEERAQRGQSALGNRLQPRADEESAQTLKALERSAEILVEDRLTLAIHEHPPVFERLVAMQRAGLEAAQSESPYDKREDVVVKAQQAIEHVLGELLRKHGRRDDHRRLMPDRQLNASLFQRLAGDCGFESPIPRNLAGVRGGKVQSAVESRGGSLLPLLLALLLGTPDVPGHPLRRAGARSPALLDDLARLAKLRDQAAHGGRRVSRQDPPPIDVLEIAYGAIEQLLLDPGTPARSPRAP